MAKDDLEIGIAAGLDVPTAIVLSEDDKPKSGRGCAWLLGCLAVLVVSVLWWLC
jgi:hypothetical protein